MKSILSIWVRSRRDEMSDYLRSHPRTLVVRFTQALHVVDAHCPYCRVKSRASVDDSSEALVDVRTVRNYSFTAPRFPWLMEISRALF